MKVLIVGSGYAGCLLSYFLTKNGVSVTVVDKNSESTSTRVSAGIILPVTGRRLVKTYKADNVIPFAVSTYRDVEQATGINFYSSKEVLQLFSSEGNKNDWFARSADDELTGYIGNIIPSNEISPCIHNSHGGIVLQQSGFVDPLQLIDAFRKINSKYLTIINATFKKEDLEILSEGINWKGEYFDLLVFCEGYECINNECFNFIPFKPAKGEIIDFTASSLSSEYIINGNLFILPLNNGSFRAGSTYEWEDLSPTPTKKGKAELEMALSKLLTCDYQIIKHQAGVRPSIDGRRPVIGFHHIHSQLGIFNGLGTKGVMLAPYFAHQFSELIVNQKLPDAEVDVKRFYPKASKP